MPSDKSPGEYTTLELFLDVQILKNAGLSKGSVPPLLESGQNMTFNHVNTSLLPSETQKRKPRGERKYRPGATNSTIVDAYGDMPPPPQYRRTRHNRDWGIYI